MQLEESEGTRRHVNWDEHDGRRIAHLQVRSRSGKATALPQHVKAVLNHSESGAALSAMSEDGVGSGLVVVLEASKPTGRTRLSIRDAVKNPACNTPNASTVLEELSE